MSYENQLIREATGQNRDFMETEPEETNDSNETGDRIVGGKLITGIVREISDSPSAMNWHEEKAREAYFERAMDAGTHFFNGDRLEVAKRELEGRRATIYHKRHNGEIETLFVKICECKPRAIRCVWTDHSEGIIRERDLQGADIVNWIIGARATSD